MQGSEINATSVPAAAKTGDFSYLSSAIKVPQTNDPAEIAKLAGFGLTPGQSFPRQQNSDRSDLHERHRGLERRPVSRSQRRQQSVLRGE